ncbi:uncharacterized protein LODBEIA_P58570 [Lodderomyces beijingensis]|uniref:Mitochondrial thiamine pyrophosphate carrier 1 n=1 Tax=Lodderomyces beijingensis TaxID=1775926 RepID=A0ABP0ZU15_9ASCO
MPVSDSTFLISLISGGCAGVATDLAFFPIDTIKTRLQAQGGFFANGGYRGIYRGLGSCVIASAPSASLFFVTYDTMKQHLQPYVSNPAYRHMVAASMGEVMACIVRVPAEVIKQRAQASHMGLTSSWSNLMHIVRGSSSSSSIRGLYRGWNSTLMREIPFTVVQFPLYEYLKSLRWDKEEAWERHVPAGFRGAVCGMIAGGVSAAVTTPLDVVKTRIMLSEGKVGASEIVRQMVKKEGMSSLWKGVVPRTCWISCGGAIFLGVYELVSNELMKTRL